MGHLARTRRAALCVLLVTLSLALAPPPPATADVVRYGGDNLNTGWYADQHGLNPNAVSASDFGQLWSTNVTGQVYAQPLVSNGTVFIATEDNTIYGLDERTGAVRWTRAVHPTPWHTADLQCPDISPNMGVTGTPVIDPATNTAYFYAKTYANGSSGPAMWYLHAVDVATGAERSGFPVPLFGNATNAPTLAFDPTQQAQRPGLLLMDGVVYAAFGGHCTRYPYQGWVVGVSTSGSIRTLWATTDPGNGEFGGGIWQSGGALVSDRPGSILFATGNGSPPTTPTPGTSPPNTGLGISVVRLSVQPNGSLAPTDFFSPHNSLQLAEQDIDLGSGAPLVLPPESFGTAEHPHLAVEVGKDGNVFLLDADDLGGHKQGPNGGDKVVSRAGPDGGVWSRPTPWGGDGGYVYIATSSPGATGSGSSGVLHAYKYGLDGAGTPTLSLVATANESLGFGSGPPVVTSSGTTTGSAVLWQIQRFTNGSGQLNAYDPVPVNGVLNLRRSFNLGATMKFTQPGVSGDKLFVGANGHVMAFGRPTDSVFAASVPSFPKTTIGQSSSANVVFTARQATTVSDATVASGGAPNEFAITGPPAPPHGTALKVGDTVTYPVTFTPTVVGPGTSTLTVTTPQGIAVATLTGVGQSPNPLLVSNPTEAPFGTIAVNTTRSSAITLSNAGAQPVTFNTVTAPAAPFSATGLPAPGSQLASGASIAVNLTYAPTALGDHSGQLAITSTGGNLTIPLTGAAGTPGMLSVSPTTITYPNTPIGGWAEASFTVTNTGGSDLTIVKSKPPLGGAFSALTNLPEGTRIGAGHSVIERVRFAPTTATTQTASWDLGGDGSSPQISVNLTGTGTPNSGIPDPSVGGWHLQGTAVQQGPLTVLTQAVDYTAGSAFWPQSLNPAGVSVSFDLTTDQGTGADGTTFAIVPGESGTEGTGAMGGGFGWFGMGGVAVVFNEFGGNASVRTEAGTVQSTAAIPSLNDSTRRIDIALAANNVRVSIDGTQVLNANVTLPTNARLGFTAGTGGSNNRHAVSNVTFSGVAPVLSVAPSTVSFGSVAVNTTATATMVIANTGSAQLSISSRTAPSAPFAAPTMPAAGTLIAPGRSISFPVTFSPTAATASSSSLSFTTNGGNVTVPLSGTGYTPSGTILPAPWGGSGWSINGNASVAGNSLVLTPNAANQAGNAVSTGTYAFGGLKAAFDLTIDQGNGADGACFALVPSDTPATALGGAGGGMGWNGMGGTAVCFDTYQNPGEPSANFVGIADANGYTATSSSIPPMRNATQHVDVAVTGTAIAVKVNGVQVLTGTLTTATTGRVVFSAGTGGLTDRHMITNTTITAAPPPAPVLSVSPASIPFGNVTIGTSATSNVTVSNTGNAPLTISSSTAPAAPFSATMPANGTTIAAGSSIPVSVSYAPSAATTSNGSLSFTTNGGNASVTLSGTGVAPAGAVVLPSPTSGSGWSINGNASASAAGLVLTPNAASQAGTAVTTSTYRFDGMKAAFDLTIDQGNGADGACFAMVPSGTAATAVGSVGGGLGWIGMGGTAVCFDTYKNSTSEPSANFVAIRTNSGIVASSSSIPALRNTTTHVDIAVTGTSIAVKLNGVQVLTGTLSTAGIGRVAFTGGTGGVTDRHLVTNASVTAAAPAFAASPSSVTFGSVTVGTSSSRTVTLTNTGGAPLTISSSTGPAAPFTAAKPANGTTIAPGASINMTVSYSPTAATSSTGSIAFTTTGGNATVALSGTGAAPTGTAVPAPWSGTGWSINGNASLSGNSLILTPNAANQAGSAVTTSTYAFNGLKVAFDLTIDQGTGADGACFAMVPSGTAATRVGTIGGGLGWSGMGGTAVCFDTFKNSTSEPSGNFVAIRTNSGIVASSSSIPTLRNATTHVDITVTGTSIVVKINGAQVLTGTLSTQSTGRLAFTAGTGGMTDRHLVTNVAITTA